MSEMPSMISQIAGFIAPILLVSLIFVLFIFRPQQKKMNEHRKFLESLKEGDEVITYGGMIGIIKNVLKDHVVLEIENNQSVRILKNYISEKYNKTE